LISSLNFLHFNPSVIPSSTCLPRISSLRRMPFSPTVTYKERIVNKKTLFDPQNFLVAMRASFVNTPATSKSYSFYSSARPRLVPDAQPSFPALTQPCECRHSRASGNLELPIFKLFSTSCHSRAGGNLRFRIFLKRYLLLFFRPFPAHPLCHKKPAGKFSHTKKESRMNLNPKAISKIIRL